MVGELALDSGEVRRGKDGAAGGTGSMPTGALDAEKLKARASRFVKGSSIPKPANVDGSGVAAIMKHPLTVLIACFPVAVASHFLNWGELWTFWLSFVSMIPMAKILGDATEELAAGLQNDMLAGLLNATFGNAVELVITIQTLRAGLFGVVKASLLGSVLSNMLLVLGMSFFCGGITNSKKQHAPLTAAPTATGSATLKPSRSGSGLLRSGSGLLRSGSMPVGEEAVEEVSYFAGEKVQHFQVMTALVNTSMLLLSCLSFTLVTVFHSITFVDGVSYMESTLLPVSRICSIIIASAYVAYIIFQLFTHRAAMGSDPDGDDKDEEEDAPALSVHAAMGVLTVTTVLVALASELLVNAIEEVTASAHMSEHFIGIILLPIVGNACEHAAAVRFAMQDKPGLSIGIAVGSSTQISLFVVPFSVLLGWAIKEPMDLNFGALNTTVMTLSVIVVLSVVVDGTSNWLQGYLLCSAYAVIAVLYWFLPNEIPKQV